MIEDWDSGCDHVTDSGNGSPFAHCADEIHPEPDILARWRESLNGHYKPESHQEQARLWKGRIKRQAWDTLKAEPEYHKAHLTWEMIQPTLTTELWNLIDSTRTNSAYAAYRPPDWMSADQITGALSVVCEAAWLDFVQYDRNKLLLGTLNGLPELPKAKKRGTRGTMTMAVEPEPSEWLWPNRIQIGKICDIQGDPGTGKSAITASIAAIVSTAGTWPTGEQCEGGGVIMINGEEDLKDGIVPHLIAAGADRRRIKAYTLHDVPLFEMPRDLEMLEQDVKELKVKAVVIDPLDCFVSEDVEMNRNQTIRRQVLAALARMAAEYKFAVIQVRHLNKDAKTKVAMYRGSGSIGLNAASRAVWMVGPSPDQPGVKIMAMIKISNAPPQRSLSYELEQVVITNKKKENIPTLRVKWLGEVDVAATELLQDPPRPKKEPGTKPKIGECMNALRAILADGEFHDSTEVEGQLKLQGFSHGLVWDAKKELKVKAKQKGFHEGWCWYLPQDTENPTAYDD